MIPRYNIVVGVAIRLDTSKVTKQDIIEIQKNNKAMFDKMFPSIEVYDTKENTCFITGVYSESHQVTYDIVGKFKPSHDLIMLCNSDQECIAQHFPNVITEFFGHVDHEFEVFSLDHLVCTGSKE